MHDSTDNPNGGILVLTSQVRHRRKVSESLLPYHIRVGILIDHEQQASPNRGKFLQTHPPSHCIGLVELQQLLHLVAVDTRAHRRRDQQLYRSAQVMVNGFEIG